ncbi:MAG: AI-2E family transporter, partial [Burkholderiaceae bacterium]|nr:AI-2E family transporter [Burkholderiaceae bacterium]
MTPHHLQDKVFVLLLITVTIAFGAILWQFQGAIFWGIVLAILFAPLHRRLLKKMAGRSTLAALCTLCLCLVIVVIPMTAITVSLVQEASSIYDKVKTGQINFGLYLQQVIAALPSWVADMLDKLHLTSVDELQQ